MKSKIFIIIVLIFSLLLSLKVESYAQQASVQASIIIIIPPQEDENKTVEKEEKEERQEKNIKEEVSGEITVASAKDNQKH